MIAKLRQQFEKLVWTDYLYSYGVPGRLAAGVMRFIVAVIRDMFAGGLMMRAMSLVYITLLSIVPVVAMAFGIAKGFGFEKDLEQQLLQNFGGQEEVLTRIIEPGRIDDRVLPSDNPARVATDSLREDFAFRNFNGIGVIALGADPTDEETLTQFTQQILALDNVIRVDTPRGFFYQNNLVGKARASSVMGLTMFVRLTRPRMASARLTSTFSPR